MLTLLSKVAIHDPNNPGTVATLTNIMEGVDGSSTFGYSIETEMIAVEDNQTQQYSEVHTLDIRVVEESSETAKLLAFVADGTKVKIAGYGPQAMLLWDEPVTISINEQYDGVLSLAVVSTLKTTIGYPSSGGKASVVASRNILDLYDMPNVLEATVEAKDFFFPFPGVQLVANAATGIATITAKDSAGSTLGSNTSTVPVSYTLPADTVFVNVSYGTYDASASLQIV